MKWRSDFIQFPRLLSEICATQELDIKALADSMDLSESDVHELLDRAQAVWATLSDPRDRFIVTSDPPVRVDDAVESHENIIRHDDDGERWALAWVKLPRKSVKKDDRQLVMPGLPPCRLT